MEERASLKSSGRFENGQEQVFYELILTERHYLVKYYNQLGKLKLIKPIKFPSDGVEIHTASNYLFCYLHNNHDPTQSEIFTIRLDSCLLDIKSCKLHLQCKRAPEEAITQIYYDADKGTFIFGDEAQNIYLLLDDNDQYICKKLYTNSKVITRIQTDRVCNIVLTTEERLTKVLTMDWDRKEVVREQIHKEQIDYYFQNGYEVRVYDENPGRGSADKVVSLQIRQGGEFKYMMRKDSDLIFYSNNRDFLIVFDKKYNVFIVLIEGIFKTYGEEKDDKPVPFNLQDHNFTVVYKKDSFKNIIIQLRVFNELTSTFTTFEYTFSELGKRFTHSSFLKKHLDKILDFNGLISPLYEDMALKAIEEIERHWDDFDKSGHDGQNEGSENFVDLACRLMRIGLLQFPRQLEKIIHKVKNHIAYVRSTYCIVETKRLFEYCELISADIATNLQKAYRNRDRMQQARSDNTKQKATLARNTKLLTSMINFLVLMLNELQVELDIHKEKASELRENHSIDNLQTEMKYYREVTDSVKSLYLINLLLSDEDIHLKISEQFGKLISRRHENLSIWGKHHQSLCLMEYPPCFLHEHFKTTSHLFHEENRKPNFRQFFSYLLDNKKKFLEVAYFYQYVLKIASVPFLDTDISDLLENILIHMPTIQEPLALVKRENEEDQENDEYLRIPSLLNKMVGTAIKIKQFSIIKYLIQLSVTYKSYPLAVLLVHSKAFSLSKDDHFHEKEHVFIIKSLLLAGRFNLAYLYVLENYSKTLFSEFVRWAKASGNHHELLLLQLEGKILKGDESLISILEQSMENVESVST